MGSLLLDWIFGRLSHWRHAYMHSLFISQGWLRRSFMLRRTLAAIAVTMTASIVTTPLGALHPLRPEGAGGLVIATGVLAWLTMPMCARIGYHALHNGLRVMGLLSIIAGAALVGSTRYHLPAAAALTTLLVSLIAGLVCLFPLQEGAAHLHAHAPLPLSLRLLEWLYSALFLSVLFLPFGAPHVLSDPLAFAIARFVPITLGITIAWGLIEQARQYSAACSPGMQRIGWISLATEAFFVLSPTPLSLGWDCALVLLTAQFTTIHLSLQQELSNALAAAQADAAKARHHLRAWKQRQQETMRQQAAWMALAAHDIKDPLHLMTLLSAQIAHGADADQPDPLLPEYARRLHSSCQRFGRFVDLFLDFAGQQVCAPIQLHLTRVQPVALTRQVIADEQVLTRTPLTLELTPPADLPGMRLDEDATAYWDKARYEAVVVNLLSNAVKFSRNAPVTVRLWQPDSDHITLDVADQGRGMAPEDLARIFEPFYRAENARETRGHGLGLTMVKAVVERHGGTIEARSAPGKGTLVRVTLPCEAREREEETKNV